MGITKIRTVRATPVQQMEVSQRDTVRRRFDPDQAATSRTTTPITINRGRRVTPRANLHRNLPTATTATRTRPRLRTSTRLRRATRTEEEALCHRRIDLTRITNKDSVQSRDATQYPRYNVEAVSPTLSRTCHTIPSHSATFCSHYAGSFSNDGHFAPGILSRLSYVVKLLS